MRTIPVDQAIAALDQWITTIAGYASTNNNGTRVDVEVARAMDDVAAIASVPLAHEARRTFLTASIHLADLAIPLATPNVRREWIAWRDKFLFALAD